MVVPLIKENQVPSYNTYRWCRWPVWSGDRIGGGGGGGGIRRETPRARDREGTAQRHTNKTETERKIVEEKNN